MKLRNILLSHAAVFACGAAIVFVARGPADGPETTAGSTVSSRHGTSRADSGAASVSSEARKISETRETITARRSEGPAAVMARLDRISLISDPLDRQAALLEFIGRLGAGDFAAVAGQYRATEHYGNSRGEFEMILRGWTKVDPPGALDYTTKTLRDRSQTSLVLAAWAGGDASAAERWALANHKGDGPNPYLSAVIQGVAAHDIARASQLAESMPQSHERGEAMEAIARALMVQGAETAMAYPQTIRDPNLRAGYVARIADRLANRDAEKAAAWLASMNDPEAQRRAAREVSESLARQNVSRAADWVRKLDPAAQAEAARGVVAPMSSSDITGTARWVSTLAGIPNYDSVVEEFVWSCDQRAPEQSAAWIRGISDPAQQTRLYHRMLGEWARRDADAVRNWVANNQVPNSVTQRFSR
jgi:hypothetical protein